LSVLCKGSHQYGNKTVIKTIGRSREEVINVSRLSASFPRLRIEKVKCFRQITSR